MRLVWLALALASCAHPRVVDAAAEARGRELALRAARAQGGLARWTTIGGVRLHVHASGLFEGGALYPDEGDYLLDPARNRAVARFSTRLGPTEWRYDGKTASITVAGRCTGTPGSRKKVAGLLSNLLFWFGVPWKFLDEGAHPAELDGRLYVTYRAVGDTPDDRYDARLDERGRVVEIRYVASVLSTRLELETRWTQYRTVAGLELAMHREFGPRSPSLRSAMAPGILDFSQLRTGLPLDDAVFAPCEVP